MTRSETTPERAARDIQTLIGNKGLKAGDPLPAQRSLAATLGVSRTSLREALATLETLGIVHVQAGKGVYIADRLTHTPLGQDRNRQAAQVYQFRLAIEPYVAGLAAHMRTRDHLSALQDSIDHMRTALEADDLIAAASADTDFHEILLDASGNPMFADAMHPAAQTIHENQMLPFANATAISAPLSEHELVLRHVSNRNPSGARDAMHLHVLSAATRAKITFLRP
ncbi:FCD domain-containing protein [Thalassospira sp.]|uniref:FadR/GntR family transcriptional regulator n=1 Tax=Thalassospira sp. TaxID=1912094 RepID=UPI000C3B5774|nr:FCD domain-containing protein [Thalassospira sp.]MBC08472.1 GntR family transcriptional regulator [Thalassospira sp.]|tara:strand:+ start:274 stop:951 length:678 start_codon:yes stop_codon:yes gene_type:complete